MPPPWTRKTANTANAGANSADRHRGFWSEDSTSWTAPGGTMALQTSIAEYFNLRKRGAADDLKKVTSSNKVLILDKNAVATDTSKDVESSGRSIIYAESPQGSTKKTNSVPKRSRKTPLVASRRLSASKDKKETTQPDIRKCLWPSKVEKIVEESDPKPSEEVVDSAVNVPFHIHSLSPKKKPSTPTKAPSTPAKTETKDADPTHSSAVGLSTPKKEENVVNDPQEGSSAITSDKISVTKSARSEALQKSTKLADLKNRLKKFNDGFNKLKEIQDRKEKLAASPKIQEFKTIELEVNVSPKKPTAVAEEVKALKSPSLLRKSLFMSPTKPSAGASTYVSPRKLFDKPPPSSPSKPAYQRFFDLAVAGKPALPLPYKYRCLAETFRSVDTVVSMMYNRNENIVFNKLRASVQQLSKRNLNESHIGQIMTVLPIAFELKREKVRSFGSQREQYELVLKPIISEGETTRNDGDKVKVSMSPSILLQRRRDFYNALLEKAKDHHELFLSNLDPPLVIPKDKLMRWHPDFDVDSCADIPPASLPSAPIQEKLSTAKDVLIKAKDMLSSNNRMEKALERLSGSQPPPPTSETAAATAALAKALKGIPKSLLEKVRAKQAAKTAALLTRCPEETKRRLELTRLPELSRILRNIFVLERKNVIPLAVILEKISQSYREVLSQDDLLRHIQLIKESVPGWITEIMDGDKKYVRLSRDADFARITNRLQQLITDNKDSRRGNIFAMSEEMNLPESLERLEISPDKSDCCKQDEVRGSANQRHSINASDEPERILESLSISTCNKGRCTCHKTTDNRNKDLKRLVRPRRPILRKSKLSQAVLRAPVLRLPGDGGSDLSSPPLATTPEGVRPLTALLPDPSLGSGDEESGASSSILPSNSEGRRNAAAQSTCCAVQARLTAHAHSSTPTASDDTSMDELASYFDLFVHIPKKMSQMAEMMYI
ncbi:hypothetical protein GE061_002946 [Apolygus lucorum]|uniref:CDT1 Geminin-binding domain-containing protein n=1 Tax=Apolygus lucorum TaxID=248454 RepID=A0A8S9X2F1_APOLU|nr:hypothetical protein GE061_002946 [Apolygus lucorum]